MATFTNTLQGITYQIPDDGEVFLLDDRGWTIGIRQGNTFYSFNLETLGREALLAEDPTWKGDAYQARAKATELLNLQGINTSGLTYYNDVFSYATKEVGTGFTSTTDTSLLKSQPVPETQGETITKEISADNLQAPVLTSDKQGIILDPEGGGADPNATLQDAATAAGTTITNPNLQFNQTGSTEGFTQTVQQPESFATTDPNRIINQTTGQTAASLEQYMTDIDTRFWLQPGETIDQYNQRVLSLYPSEQKVSLTSGAITGDMLGGSRTLDFRTSPSSSPYDISALGSTYAATPQETKISSEMKQLADLNKQTLGESAFRSQQEQTQGVPGLQQTQRDLTSRLTALKNESSQIPLQIQQDFQGRGATKAGTAPIQTAQLRNNAIQALTVNSLLEAANGNLTTALDMVERAVAAKFDPIKEQIRVAKDNLNLLINDPETSRQDTIRAQAQVDIKNAQERALSVQAQNQKNIWNIAVDAASNGATALILDRIQKAQTPEEALRIATEAGVYQQGAGDQFTLGTNQIRYDAQGNPIAYGPAGGSSGGDESPLSINQIEQFRRSYGWTPPYGFTTSQLTAFMDANPGLSPEQYESLANQAAQINEGGQAQPDRNTLEGIKSRIQAALGQDFATDEIKDAIKQAYTTDELFAIAKAAGYAKWYTGKETDIDRMLDALIAQ